jgi:hypothetical protein
MGKSRCIGSYWPDLRAPLHSRISDRSGFCGLGISQAPAARNVYSSGKKKARKLRRSDISACRPAGAETTFCKRPSINILPSGADPQNLMRSGNLGWQAQDSSPPALPVSHSQIVELNVSTWHQGCWPVPSVGNPRRSPAAKYHIRSGWGCTML